jgi:drug/metabolite transporter (DMT)-like permease
VLIPFTLYFAGLQHLTPTNAVIASCLEPVFTVLIAALALHETVRPLQAFGIVLVLSAILVAQRPSRDAVLEPIAGPVD